MSQNWTYCAFPTKQDWLDSKYLGSASFIRYIRDCFKLIPDEWLPFIFFSLYPAQWQRILPIIISRCCVFATASPNELLIENLITSILAMEPFFGVEEQILFYWCEGWRKDFILFSGANRMLRLHTQLPMDPSFRGKHVNLCIFYLVSISYHACDF